VESRPEKSCGIPPQQQQQQQQRHVLCDVATLEVDTLQLTGSNGAAIPSNNNKSNNNDNDNSNDKVSKRLLTKCI